MPNLPLNVTAIWARLRATQVQAETLDEYISRLKARGIKFLNRGQYSMVFQHPTMPDVAVKVFKSDSAFLDYVAFCESHPDNPYCLKILDHKEDPTGLDLTKQRMARTGYHVLFVEKLKPLSSQGWTDFCTRIETLAGLSPKGNINLHAYRNRIGLWTRIAGQHKDPELAEFATWYVQAMKTHNYDIHKNNVMLRGTQPVIIDPLY